MSIRRVALLSLFPVLVVSAELPPLENMRPVDDIAKNAHKALDGYLKRRKKGVDVKHLQYWSDNAGLFWFCAPEGAEGIECYKLKDKKGAWIVQERLLPSTTSSKK